MAAQCDILYHTLHWFAAADRFTIAAVPMLFYPSVIGSPLVGKPSAWCGSEVGWLL